MEEKTGIFGGKASLWYFGKNRGDFKPTNTDFHAKMMWVMEHTITPLVFAPSLAFTKRTASLTSIEEKLTTLAAAGLKPVEKIIPGTIRTAQKADGGIIFLDELPAGAPAAIAMFNADCPFVVGTIQRHGKTAGIFMVHGGLDCLHKPGETDRQTIIHKMIADYNLNPANLHIFVTAGIQPCCYGRSDTRFDEIFELWGSDLRGTANKGPRAGQTSLDLSGLIKKILLHAGIPEKQITVDNHCTSCDGGYWSNILEPSPRNCVLFKLL